MGAHVSACPNHGTARITPLKTRGVVAYFGTYGIELDITKMTDEEKTEIKRQIIEFKKYYNLIQNGEYYRLQSPYDNKFYVAWEVSRADESEALVAVVRADMEAAFRHELIKVKGLNPNANYRINGSERVYSGAALMVQGFIPEFDFFSYPARLYHITLA